ncbi:hypothetical protein GWK47_015538 [Chionoecetes opilio]|uniref:Uncharacterized protein n=1 Tax=Chionoecetes opilio TaxID=41210 RepID=A0A8J5CKL3_CHIOP|nr:hypothetical protein GWK47_015538 [Chionoecetes opilio]
MDITRVIGSQGDPRSHKTTTAASIIVARPDSTHGTLANTALTGILQPFALPSSPLLDTSLAFLFSEPCYATISVCNWIGGRQLAGAVGPLISQVWKGSPCRVKTLDCRSVANHRIFSKIPSL